MECNATIARNAGVKRRTLVAALVLALATAAPVVHAEPRRSIELAQGLREASAMSASARGAFAREQRRVRPEFHGRTRAVSNCADSGAGSLRDAVAAAASGDTVDVSALACSTITLTSGIDIDVAELDIVGPGPGLLTVTNGSKYGRVFSHSGTGLLQLEGMTISGGVVAPTTSEADTRGGCVFSNGLVALGDILDPANAAKGVFVQQCTAVSTQAGVAAAGGGVYADGGLSLASSVISGCVALAQDDATVSRGGGGATDGTSFSMKYSEVRDSRAVGTTGFGGGIDAAFVGSMLVSHSTIAGNSATNRAGGAYLGTYTGNPVSIDNSTISGNSSPGESGILVNVMSGATPGSITVASTTVTANVSDGGFGGASFHGPTDIQASIFAGNTGVDLDLSTVPTGADVLVGTVTGAPPPDGLVVTDDAGLAPLAGNGGTTRTHALLEGSRAIDAGNNVGNALVDQRGRARSLGAAPDIGAYEHDPDQMFANGFE